MSTFFFWWSSYPKSEIVYSCFDGEMVVEVWYKAGSILGASNRDSMVVCKVVDVPNKLRGLMGLVYGRT
jgi:hypothetical protein